MMNGGNDNFASEGDPDIPSGTPGGGSDSSSVNSDGYQNGDDAFPEYGEASSEPIELWEDDVRRVRNRAGNFELVPLTPGNSDDDLDLDDNGGDVGDGGEFEYSDDEDDGDSNGGGGRGARIRRRKAGNGAYQTDLQNAYPGDDYATSTSVLARLLPRRVYHHLYPPGVPRQVQLLRLENLAVPACYLLVGLLQGLSGPFTNVYPLDLNASEAQQVRERYIVARVRTYSQFRIRGIF